MPWGTSPQIPRYLRTVLPLQVSTILKIDLSARRHRKRGRYNESPNRVRKKPTFHPTWKKQNQQNIRAWCNRHKGELKLASSESQTPCPMIRSTSLIETNGCGLWQREVGLGSGDKGKLHTRFVAPALEWRIAAKRRCRTLSLSLRVMGVVWTFSLSGKTKKDNRERLKGRQEGARAGIV